MATTVVAIAAAEGVGTMVIDCRFAVVDIEASTSTVVVEVKILGCATIEVAGLGIILLS